MNLEIFMEKSPFETVNIGDELDKTLTKLYCCDLLSIAMGKAPQGSIWVTVMGNINTLAVASLADVGCIILAEGVNLDEIALSKAKLEGITVLKTKEPVFETAQKAFDILNS